MKPRNNPQIEPTEIRILRGKPSGTDIAALAEALTKAEKDNRIRKLIVQFGGDNWKSLVEELPQEPTQPFNPNAFKTPVTA